MKPSPEISVSSVCERDIDLLLLEEFVATPAFGSWFVNQARTSDTPIGPCVSAKRSVTQSSGESDLEVMFHNEAGHRLLVMIENKVGAGFQPFQAERYRQRASGYLDKGECHEVLTVLTAPESYFGGSDTTKGFDGRVTYEAIQAWYGAVPGLGGRLAYKEALLQSAIEKGTLGYQPVEDAVTTGLWKDYWQLAREHAPELRMPEPGVKPSAATFVWFKQTDLPQGIDIVHKLTGTQGASVGYVDLQIAWMGAHVYELKIALDGLLEADMTILRTSGSAVVRLVVEMVDPNRAASSQMDEILAGLEAARRLLGWFRSDPRISEEVGRVLEQQAEADE